MVKLGGTTRVALVPKVRDEGFCFIATNPVSKLNLGGFIITLVKFLHNI